MSWYRDPQANAAGGLSPLRPCPRQLSRSPDGPPQRQRFANASLDFHEELNPTLPSVMAPPPKQNLSHNRGGAGPSGANQAAGPVGAIRKNLHPILALLDSDEITISDDDESVVYMELEGVNYIEKTKQHFTYFPIDKKEVCRLLTKPDLLQFCRANKIEVKTTFCKEHLFFLAKEFLDEKRQQQVSSAKRVKGVKKEERKSELVLIETPEKQFAEPPINDVLDDSFELVSDEMINQLPTHLADRFKNMKTKATKEIKNHMACFGIELDPSLSRSELLEKFYVLLSENVRAEDGIAFNRENAPPSKRKRESTVLTNECCICMDKRIKSYIVPCGHAALCDACSKGIRECPVCRTAVKSILPVYFS